MQKKNVEKTTLKNIKLEEGNRRCPISLLPVVTYACCLETSDVKCLCDECCNFVGEFDYGSVAICYTMSDQIIQNADALSPVARPLSAEALEDLYGMHMESLEEFFFVHYRAFGIFFRTLRAARDLNMLREIRPAILLLKRRSNSRIWSNLLTKADSTIARLEKRNRKTD